MARATRNWAVSFSPFLAEPPFRLPPVLPLPPVVREGDNAFMAASRPLLDASLASLFKTVVILMDDDELPSPAANTDERKDRKSDDAEDNDIAVIYQVVV
jgi:hypothetical protein